MAFITGIYHRLLAAISAFDLRLLQLLAKRQWKSAWTQVDAPFLLTLGAGIATSVLSLARLISYLLVAYPLLVWSLFFGLILGSALILMRNVTRWTVAPIVSLLAGAGWALWAAVRLCILDGTVLFKRDCWSLLL